MKRGKMLGGKPPRRGGRLTGPRKDLRDQPKIPPQILIVVAVGFLVIGVIAGFAWGLDREIRGGILAQRSEAMQRPDWVPLEELPAYVPRAFLTVVDPAFEHGGSLRARDDANTLPRELVRQIHMLGEGLGSEARQLVMAPVLEQRTSKPALLELYLNRVYLGVAQEAPVYGIFHAAREYLGKDPREVTLGEAATLAGLLLEPRIEDPDTRPGAAGIRRNEVLAAILATGAITEAEYRAALDEPLPFQPGLREIPMSRRLPSLADTIPVRVPALAPPPSDSPEATD